MQQLLTNLQPRLQPDEEGSIRDNAVGALSRLVLTYGSALPLAAIVAGIVQQLPLTVDSGENLSAARAMFKLVQDEAARPHVTPHLAQLLTAFSRLLTTDKKHATDELRGELLAFLRWLAGVAPETQAMLPPEVLALLSV